MINYIATLRYYLVKKAKATRPTFAMPLNNAQRALFGALDSGCGGAVALLEGIVTYYYSNHLGVSLEYLSLSNFVIGFLAVFVALIVGTMSDRSKGTFRRKPYLMVFGPIWALGVFLRIGMRSVLTSKKFAPIYYVVTYALQVIGSTGQSVTTSGWGCELAQEVSDRSKLYSWATGIGFLGIFLGIAFTSFPLALAGVLGSILIMITVFSCLIYLPDNVPIEKRIVFPTLTNIQSVFWNSEFRTFLFASSCAYFINTVPALYLFFLIYAVGLGSKAATSYYTVSVLAFVLCGLCVIPLVGKIMVYGKVTVLRRTLLMVVFFGLVLLAASYGPAFLVVIFFGVVGGTSTLANITLSICGADTIDYDELLCGKKRAATYQSILNLARLLITISGTSIPLAIMSALGFESSSDADDDDSMSSTKGATLTIRLWCSLFISIVFCGAYFFMRKYRLTEDMHSSVVSNISKRDEAHSKVNTNANAAGLEEGAPSTTITSPLSPGEEPRQQSTSSTSKSSTNDVSDRIGTGSGTVRHISGDGGAGPGGATETTAKGTLFQVFQDVSKAVAAEDEDDLINEELLEEEEELTTTSVSSIESSSLAGSEIGTTAKRPTTTSTTATRRRIPQPLDSVDDPITAKAVSPPPFAQLTYIMKKLLREEHGAGAASKMTLSDERQLRLLCCYFPTTVEPISTESGRILLLKLFAVKLGVGVVVLTLGIWQSIYVLVKGYEFSCYLFVVLTVLYAFYVLWQVLHVKGLRIVRNMEKSPGMKKLVESALVEINMINNEDATNIGSGETTSLKESLVIKSRTLKSVQNSGADLIHGTLLQLIVLIATWVAAFTAVNFGN